MSAIVNELININIDSEKHEVVYPKNSQTQVIDPRKSQTHVVYRRTWITDPHSTKPYHDIVFNKVT